MSVTIQATTVERGTDAQIDAGTHCPLCRAPYKIQAARIETFDRPVLVCTGMRTQDDPCGFWVYDHSPEADTAAEQAREGRRRERAHYDAIRAAERETLTDSPRGEPDGSQIRPVRRDEEDVGGRARNPDQRDAGAPRRMGGALREVARE